jgi:hypothetical protein
MPLFHQVSPQCPHNSSPELIRAAVSPPRRVMRPLVPSCRFCAHGRVRQITLSALELFPKPLEPRHGQSPRLRRDFVARSSGATAPTSGHQPLDLGHPSEIGRVRLIRADLTSALDPDPTVLLSPPHTRPCHWARPVSPTPVR